MWTLLSKFFASNKTSASATAKHAPVEFDVPIDMPPVQWRADSAFPVPRGQAFRSALQAKELVQTPYWRALFQTWFIALAPGLQAHSSYAPKGFRSAWRENYLVLSPLDERSTELLAKSCARAARRICRALPELAQVNSDGALPIIIFPDADTYEHYATYLHLTDAGEVAQDHIASAGMFVRSDDDALPKSEVQSFGYFMVLADEIGDAEPTLVHEMTHALLSHLNLPLWINEGIATMMEGTVESPSRDPAFVINRRAELLSRHRQFWDEQTTPTFWDGLAFNNGASSELAYDMAFRIVFELARDLPSFSAFAKSADPTDGGNAAAMAIYGFPVEALLEAHLQLPS